MSIWNAVVKTANKEIYDLHPSPNIILVITSRRMRWAEHVARMGDRKGAYRVLVGRLFQIWGFKRRQPLNISDRKSS
jgi:hypothetical protein